MEIDGYGFGLSLCAPRNDRCMRLKGLPARYTSLEGWLKMTAGPFLPGCAMETGRLKWTP
jgi:hypothetical protein